MGVLLTVGSAVLGTFLVTWVVLKFLNTRKVTRRIVFAAIAAVFCTIFATLIYANLTTHSTGIEQRIVSQYSVADPQFERAMGSLLGPNIMAGNSVTTLSNGAEIFPAMLSAIRGAKHTITFETFIYWGGNIGREFADALAERAKAGVKTHVLLDWLGSTRMEEELLEEMKTAGVEVQFYHPLKWYNLDRVNNRTHRKILVVDGRIGFTGGVGIGDEWTGDAQDKDHWRDSHFQLEGPAVGQLQAAFMDNWMKTSAEVLHGVHYFPEQPTTGTLKAHVFKSGHGGGSNSARLMFLLSIACAQKSVRLSQAYFVPDEFAVRTLVEAAKRGVKIQIIAPGPLTDTRITRFASRATWGELLQAGVEFYEYQPTMFHCKGMVVDSLWSSVGSTNFDERSFKLNEECNLNVLDADFAAEQERIFEEDLKKSHKITYEEWAHRPRWKKLREKVASLASSQL